jgi:hypothetical protein
MTRALIPLLSLAGLAAASSSAAAESATVRIPAPFSIDDATHVTVAPAAASGSSGVTAYGFTAQQSGVARASYDAQDAGDSFRWRMVMTVDGRVRNDTEYHTTMTLEQACGLVTMDADGEAARGRRVYLDPCTVTANQTTGVGEARTTETASRVMSLGIAGLAALGKAKQSELLLDTVTVASGKFVDAAATAASSESVPWAVGVADLRRFEHDGGSGADGGGDGRAEAERDKQEEFDHDGGGTEAVESEERGLVGGCDGDAGATGSRCRVGAVVFSWSSVDVLILTVL